MLAPLFLASLVRGHATLAKFDPRLVRHIRDIGQLPDWDAIDYDTGHNIDTGAKDGCKSAAWLMQLYFPYYEKDDFPTLVYKDEVKCGDATRTVGCFLGQNSFGDNGIGNLGPNHPRGAVVVKDGLAPEYEFHVCLHELIHAVGFLSLLQTQLDEANAGDIHAFPKTLCQLWKQEHGGAEEQPKADGHWSIDQSFNAQRQQKTGSHIYWDEGQGGVDESQSEHELMTSSVSTDFAAGNDDVVSYLSASTLYAVQFLNIQRPISPFPWSLRNDANEVRRRWCFPIFRAGEGQETLFQCEENQVCVSVHDLNHNTDVDLDQDMRAQGAYDTTWNDVPGVCVSNDGTGNIIDAGDSPGLPVAEDPVDCNYAPLATVNAGNNAGGGGGGGFIIVSSASLPSRSSSLFSTVLLAAGTAALAVVSTV